MQNIIKTLGKKFVRSEKITSATDKIIDHIPTRPIPSDYGSFWKSHDGGLEWYTWMYDGRLDQHQLFEQWFQVVNYIDPIHSVLEFGCGLAVGYADFFKDIRYVGTDIAEQLISWCQTNRQYPNHDYVTCDFIQHRFEEKFDIVFSQGTIDNVYDMDAFLHAAVASSRRWIYITAYRGFFPELSDHIYTWSEKHGCNYNDISPKQAYQTLVDCGCQDIMILPSFTGRENISFETLIIARTSS